MDEVDPEFGLELWRRCVDGCGKIEVMPKRPVLARPYGLPRQTTAERA